MNYFYLIITDLGSTYCQAKADNINDAKEYLKKHFLAFGGPNAGVQVYKYPESLNNESTNTIMQDGQKLTWEMNNLSFEIY